jgi:hypothetical protein
MSTTRRPLGTGPTTTTRSTPSLRLLPVERAELVGVEHQDVAERKGRRTLGAGHEVGLEAQQVVPEDGLPPWT